MQTRNSKPDICVGSRRQSLLVLLLITIPCGLAVKYARGIFPAWAADHGAGFFYELFWILLLAFFFPRRPHPVVFPCLVFAATSAIEWLQLLRMPWLDSLRSHEAGRILIGETFSWMDFPFYAAGCIAGSLVLRQVGCRKERG